MSLIDVMYMTKREIKRKIEDFENGNNGNR